MTHRNDRGFRAPRLKWRQWFVALGAVLLLLPAVALAQPACMMISKSFAPSTINSGGTSTLSVNFNNTCGSFNFDFVRFQDDLTKAGMQLVPGFNPNQCQGTVAATAFGFSFTNGFIGASTSCSVQVTITASSAVNVTLTNTTSNIGYCGDCFAGGVSARLNVIGGTPPTITSPPPPNGTFNTPYLHQITATGTAPITFTVSGLPPGLSFNAATGQIVGTPTQVGSFPGQILAQNGFKPDATQNYTIVISGIPPAITSPPPAPGTVGVPYSHQVTVTGTAPATVTANGLPPGLMFNAATNQVIGTPTTPGSFPGSFVASNGIPPNATQNFTLVINPPPLIITTGSPLPAGNVGNAYSTTFNATGGIPGYSWSQSGGTLPPGLSLNSAGTLSGTPTKPGAYTFDVVVTDSAKVTAKKTFTLVVDGIPPTITSGLPPAGIVGVAYSHTITVTGTPPIVVNLGALPPGLSFNSGTNQITGTPTTAGSYPGSILAFNGVPPDATQTFTIVITSPPLSIPPIPQLPPPAVGQPYPPVTITVVGGTPPYTFTVCKGSLPPGFDLSKSGVLSGTPTQAGSFTFDVCVTDGSGNTTSTTLTLVVAAVSGNITVTIAPNPDVSGIPVTVDLQVGGGNATATGTVHVAAAGTGQRCPPPFSVGSPTDPLAPDHAATLDAKGHATITLNNLKIDDYLVCVNYSGDAAYAPGSAGPFPLAVIKGLLLGSPKVTLIVPDRVPMGSTIAARIEVTPVGTARIPQGVVVVRNGDSDIAGTVLVNGVATVPIVASGAGMLRLSADYVGDGAFPGASSDTVQVVVDGPVAAAPPFADIPTLSEYALALLMLALMIAGWWQLKRRRA